MTILRAYIIKGRNRAEIYKAAAELFDRERADIHRKKLKIGHAESPNRQDPQLAVFVYSEPKDEKRSFRYMSRMVITMAPEKIVPLSYFTQCTVPKGQETTFAIINLAMK